MVAPMANWMRASLGRWAVAGALVAAVATATAAPNFQLGPKKEEFQTAAPNAILIDADSGTILFEKNADQLVAPASLAKLMTAEVVFNEIKEGNIKLEDEYVISTHAWRKGGAPSGGSTMFAAIHSRVKVGDLLRGVIIHSGNDACIALAEGIAGNEGDFARLMNGRAHELGLSKSNFTNPHGMPDPQMRVTVRELARLAQHIIRTYPEFYEIYGEKEFTWNKIRQFNRNPLLTMGIGADGMKTGYTQEAGYGLVGSAVQNDLRLIVVVTQMKSAKERADEAKKLLEWGFKGFESRPLFAEGQIIGEAKVFGGAQGRVPLVAKGGVTKLMIPRGSNDRIIARVVYTGPVPAPIEKGRTIGKLKIWRNDNLALEMPLEAAESVEVGNLPQRALDAATELVINLFRSGAGRI
jgi:D-alanyl-D-alanine carboxypeptidase (penicillin-binding protein 5/6)